MKIFKHILFIVMVFALIGFTTLYSRAQTLEIVKIVMVDYDQNGMTDGFEIEFNNPVNDATFDVNDWSLSNDSAGWTNSVKPDDIFTDVKFITGSDINVANDNYIRVFGESRLSTNTRM